MIAIVVELKEIVRGSIAEVVRKYRLDINKVEGQQGLGLQGIFCV